MRTTLITIGTLILIMAATIGIWAAKEGEWTETAAMILSGLAVAGMLGMVLRER